MQESDELYLLSPVNDASVKVRDELLDVKQLQQVDEHGLEQWLPVLKAQFPVAREDVSTVLAALSVRAPLERASYTLDELLELNRCLLGVCAANPREGQKVVNESAHSVG